MAAHRIGARLAGASPEQLLAFIEEQAPLWSDAALRVAEEHAARLVEQPEWVLSEVLLSPDLAPHILAQLPTKEHAAGDEVQLTNLSKAHLNGARGVAVGYDAERGRISVRLVDGGPPLAVRPANLVKAAPLAAEEEGGATDDEAEHAAWLAALPQMTATQLGAELLEAARYGEEREVGELLAAKADVNHLDGNTALHRACANGHVAVVQQLAAAGAALLANESGNSPLHWAVQHASAPLVAAAFPGADVLARNAFGKSVSTEAFARNVRLRCRELSSIGGDDPSAVRLAAAGSLGLRAATTPAGQANIVLGSDLVYAREAVPQLLALLPALLPEGGGGAFYYVAPETDRLGEVEFLDGLVGLGWYRTEEAAPPRFMDNVLDGVANEDFRNLFPDETRGTIQLRSTGSNALSLRRDKTARILHASLHRWLD
ncbi:hypothetical protein EMIHUDRAFT_217922 [Emiliania huxleyi CCMP1516]|uniref:Ankyrin repeat domain-containing protein n=2 Tax=Emiliania huxleyi TaxID=2903 RepID=A0A0D3I9J1_EMIH1|nr:hypothetical protein EMIHUDRAFT_217922 [Emiliania huxleyi CCMP1516]EOD07926.1 hypothetical protein EMIHUDRAFT_217922 [Emiliania huxleyi CCMP1516]|eukprot:XP_005760355.1 hypothetical protein EMIHUDRAFT_217922 [Emiliania huxleyi CCMP1516]